VRIVDHPGVNAAYWNLHERRISKQGEKFYANERPLIFFHYSGYSIGRPHEISRHQDRIELDKNSDLKELFQVYYTALINNNHEELLPLKCYYQKNRKNIFKKLSG
jgi:hypothetical protein